MGMAVWKNLFSLELIKKYDIQFCSERQFISEDAIFDIDYFAHADKVVISEECGYFYCENETSLSRKYQPSRFERCELLYKEEIRRISELQLGGQEELVQCIQRSYIGNARYCMQQIFYNLDKSDAVRRIEEICANSTLREVLSQYPYNNNPLILRIFNRLIEKKKGKLLWALIALKN